MWTFPRPNAEALTFSSYVGTSQDPAPWPGSQTSSTRPCRLAEHFLAINCVQGSGLGAGQWSSFRGLFARCWASLVAQLVKNLPTMQEIWVQFTGLGRPPGEGNGNPLEYYCPENSMGYSPQDCKELDTTEGLFHFFLLLFVCVFFFFFFFFFYEKCKSHSIQSF